MLTFRLDGASPPPERILCLGAHPDDIEIGCGGALMRLLAERPEVDVTWVVLSGDERRAREALESAHALLDRVRRKEIHLRTFRDGYFPWEGAAIKAWLETLKGAAPDLVFAPARHDLHQDHRVVAELAWNTFRDHLILEYEIPKYDGDLGHPNVFVALDEALARRKAAHVVRCFPSQAGRRWCSEDLLLSLLRLRGLEAGAPTGYAEAFTCRKLALG
ncbi:MAG TPA: PIG-L deacetylase family protein [Candidatus Tectomicrobia bacterium]|nr:PIG-L deacetylase family protein [Candidatus Tectomicrobia bacterium]